VSALVAYDEELADRIRELIGAEADLVERRMFGGLAFLVGGNMAVAASAEGGIMVRVDPAHSDTLIESGRARRVQMRGRSMRGWLRVPPEGLRSERDLAGWVGRGLAYARSLPLKKNLTP
jgi:TfoX/Sxy family transcriptional regulator of competence genes